MAHYRATHGFLSHERAARVRRDVIGMLSALAVEDARE